MRFPIIAIVVLFTCSKAFAFSQCPAGDACPSLQEKIIVEIFATWEAAKTTCSRSDPARAKQYQQGMETLIEPEQEEYVKAKNSKLFPAALKRHETEFDALPVEKQQRECEGLLAFATLCPAGDACPPLPEKDIVEFVATFEAANTTCSRLDPARAQQYLRGVEMLIGPEQEEYVKAKNSKLFPAALKRHETEFNALSVEEQQRECEGLRYIGIFLPEGRSE